MSEQPLLLFDGAHPDGQEVWHVELPLPPRACSPNRRGHARFHADEIKAYRRTCELLYRAANIPRLKAPVTISLDFYYYRNPRLRVWRPRRKVWEFNLCFCLDDDNAIGSFKSGRDAMFDAGLIPGDTKKSLRMGGVRLHTTAKEHQGRTSVVVTLQAERA